MAAALRAVRPTAVVYLPGELTLRTDVGGVRQAWWCGMTSELPAGRVFRPKLVARAISKDTRIALVVDEHALTHQDADGDVHRLPWADVTAAVPVDGAKGLQVFGRNLCNFLVHEDLYGRRGLDAVRSRLPEGVLVPQRS